MSEQILSQEEIDALLSSVDKGEVDLEVDKDEEPQIESYDLTSQSIMLRDQFYALEEVYDKLGNLMQMSFSSSLQKTIEAELVSTEMIKFGEFRQAFSNPTGFSIFSMEPLIGSGLLAIEPNLTFSLIDCMFGGDGKSPAQVREFTLIELRLIRNLFVDVLKSLEEAWSLVYPVKTSLKKIETKPEFIHIFAPNELVIVVAFSVKGDEFVGNIHLCISYLMLEPIKDRLSSRYLTDPELENSWNSQLQELMREIQVKITAELGRTLNSTVRDLINLQTGDIIKLTTGPQDPVTVMVQKVPKYQGLSGVVKGSQAVQITTLIR
ncbi:MAG: flagellar motor switch protein FliM [Deltaproteobacteria bacterium]|nr:flagellar motor switch protein FliM [Deltaproteobacteria bacterium]MBW1736386.1 flagellar motor switch protein FliM [Deltaproteobacteria bacterium]MBW1908125.1 flagellar motor switch protein FliM [Deltaproteobacteria bacterium]MBW2032204.1 flagellar motor switch protein FliM [Deltaproteobacteria bacterium]MBW2113777.1 flagellar motor switch protein FliM [Deltaproteobacteria bacterium]